MEQSFLARRINLEHRSVTVSITIDATLRGRSVEIAFRVSNQALQGIHPIVLRDSGEAIQHGLFARRINFKYDSAAVSATCAPEQAAIFGGSIEIADGVADQGRDRISSVAARASKAVQYGFVALGSDFENGPIAVSTVDFRGAVEIALGIENQTRIRAGSIASRFELVEQMEGSRAWSLSHTNHRGQHQGESQYLRGLRKSCEHPTASRALGIHPYYPWCERSSTFKNGDKFIPISRIAIR